jgi:hypothetical protein
MTGNQVHSLTDVEREAVRATLRRYKVEALAALKLIPAHTAEFRAMSALLDGVEKAEEELASLKPRRVRRW